MFHQILRCDRSSQSFATTCAGAGFAIAADPARTGARAAASTVAFTAAFIKACLLFAILACALPAPASAHGASAGDVNIVHPYATPSVPGAGNGVAYIATLENSGKQPDRLLRVSTPVAERAEIHTMAMDTAGVMRMREVADISVAPGEPIKMRPGEGFHFMLMGLRRPLKVGDTFEMTMEFERAGKVDVKVVVQQPAAHAAETGHAMH